MVKTQNVVTVLTAQFRGINTSTSLCNHLSRLFLEFFHLPNPTETLSPQNTLYPHSAVHLLLSVPKCDFCRALQ